MESHEDIRSLSEAEGDEFVGAKGSVSEKKVVGFEMFYQGRCGLSVVLSVWAGFDVFPTAVSKIEQADDAHGGESATGLLGRRLGIGLLVFDGVHQMDAAAIHGLEGETLPLVFGGNATGKMAADALMNRLDKFQTQSVASLAIAGSIGRWNRQFAGAAPALDE